MNSPLSRPVDVVVVFEVAAALGHRQYGSPEDPVEVQIVFRSGRKLVLHDPVFRAVPPRPAASDDGPLPGVTASPDYRCLNWHGTVFSFTEPQSCVVKMLVEATAKGVPDIGDKALLRASGSESTQLRDVFKDHPAWGTLIVEGGTRGTHRLASSSGVTA